MSGYPSLRVRAAGREWLFDASRSVAIGRLADSDVALQDSRVSRRHGELRPEAAGWFFQDTGSSGGTYVDGERVSRIPIAKSVTLHLGQQDGEPVEVSLVASESNEAPPEVVSPRPAQPGPIPQRVLAALEPSALYRPTKPTVRIGRTADNDIVVDDVTVSRHHAELRVTPTGYEIVDTGSHNGTFVDGRRVSQAPIVGTSLVGIGRHLFRMVGDTLEEYIDVGHITFDAVDLSVRLPSGQTLLDKISFTLDERSFLAILGPTGAGKSTLAKALTGFQPATSGAVLYNGRNLYQAYDELRRRIGYVPQEDILHPQLTVQRALEYAAELRFPSDVSAAERHGAVAEVMDELGLTQRARVSIGSLSGGQRKRTSVALELLTKPSLLFLDEPTSGLDPGYEKSVMALLRGLADEGRSVVVITHSIQSLDLCDRLLFLAPGGHTAYFGPPREALSYFGSDDYADVFRDLEHRTDVDWERRFEQDPASAKYVRHPLATQTALPAVTTVPVVGAVAQPSRMLLDLGILVRRYISVMASDRRNLRLLLAQAPVISLLIYFASAKGSLASTGKSGGATTVLLSLILGATFMGESNAVREIVKELPILRRERAVGLSIVAYLLSKVWVLGVVTLVQAALIVGVGTIGQHGPSDPLTGLSGPLELFVAIALTGLAAMALGLLISSLVTNADKALTILPVVLLAQFLLAGALLNLADKPVLREMSYLTTTRWGYAAAAASTDVRSLQGGCLFKPGSVPGPAQPALTAKAAGGNCDALWAHKLSTWIGDLAVLGVLTIASLALAMFALYRRDPLRAWRHSHTQAGMPARPAL